MTRAEARANLPQGWPHHIEKILELLERYRPMRCVELGTYYGASALATVRMIRQWNGRLTCIDTWAAGPVPGNPYMLTACVAHMTQAGVAASINFIAATTVDVAAHWTDPVDFLYVDAGHYYEEVRADLEAWWPHVRVGGVVCGDDYDLIGWPGVAQAWDEFEQTHGQHFERFATPNTDPPGMKLVWGIKQ